MKWDIKTNFSIPCFMLVWITHHMLNCLLLEINIYLCSKSLLIIGILQVFENYPTGSLRGHDVNFPVVSPQKRQTTWKMFSILSSCWMIGRTVLLLKSPQRGGWPHEKNPPHPWPHCQTWSYHTYQATQTPLFSNPLILPFDTQVCHECQIY